MTIQENIQQILENKFSPTYIEVVNDSASHRNHSSSPNNGESHFKIIMISNLFKGKSKLEMHRMVHDSLGDICRKVHSISMKLSA